MKPTYERVREAFDYDPVAGLLRWRVQLSPRGIVGSPAGSRNADGRLRVGLDGRSWMASNIIWMWLHGEWPATVDHKSRDPSDDRERNLRVATTAQNLQNRRKPRNNTSGVKGVTWERRRRKWRATIGINGGYVLVGRFDRVDDAAAAVAARREKMHGDFACMG